MLPRGISGSGKSYLGNLIEKWYPNKLELVCPDDIRKEMTGNISDQSKNQEVWLQAYDKVNSALSQHKLVYLSALNLNPLKTLKDIDTKNHCILIVSLNDSLDLEMCRLRIEEDLVMNKDRARIPDEVLNKQYERFKSFSPKQLELVSDTKVNVYLKDEAPFIKVKQKLNDLMILEDL